MKQFSKRSGGYRPCRDKESRGQVCARGARGALDTVTAAARAFHTRLPDMALVEEPAKSPNKK